MNVEYEIFYFNFKKVIIVVTISAWQLFSFQTSGIQNEYSDLFLSLNVKISEINDMINHWHFLLIRLLFYNDFFFFLSY
jgi:hypothetical protein